MGIHEELDCTGSMIILHPHYGEVLLQLKTPPRVFRNKEKKRINLKKKKKLNNFSNLIFCTDIIQIKFPKNKSFSISIFTTNQK